ncbi:DUF1272 domain-containing protein [Maribacter sp. 2-571]|uniref:DUF1272 domain-containing protein n=1 Tax=Maribacter sp. 2-571 TaxID=3417569 RepID=UPI003D341BE2
MLAIRPSCENCNKALPANAVDAMICSYECTFCADCVETILLNVCPNCGGGFEKRPVRPKQKLVKNPAQQKAVYRPVDKFKFEPLQTRWKDIAPEER